MNNIQLERMKSGKGFIAALDQSGGSTPKALALYGIPQSAYTNEDEMFAFIHQMRTRIIASPAFTKEHILATILFERTMNSQIDGRYSADYLWEEKGIVPILKVDKGLAELTGGVQLMKPIPNLDELLLTAKQRHIFGTKMRSVIKSADVQGIKAVVNQQFDLGRKIAATGLVPILEPEVDIHAADKAQAEALLKQALLDKLKTIDPDFKLMFKLSIPTVADFYKELIAHPNVVRVVALSGGYPQQEANTLLAKNHGMIASFSRALTEGLNANQSDAEFDHKLGASIIAIYEASIS